MKIISVSCEYHDFNITFYDSSQPVASSYRIIELERYYQERYFTLFNSQSKQDPQLLVKILKEQLALANQIWGIENDFDLCLVNKLSKRYMPLFAEAINFRKIVRCDHQVSHAATAFYLSSFDRALTIVYHGGGNDGVFNAYLMNRKDGCDDGDSDAQDKVKLIYESELNLGNGYQYVASLVKGLGKTLIAYPGKVMGLAAYGKVIKDWIEPIKEFYRNLPSSNNQRLNPADFGEDYDYNDQGHLMHRKQSGSESSVNGGFDTYMVWYQDEEATYFYKNQVMMLLDMLTQELGVETEETDDRFPPLVCSSWDDCQNLAATNQHVFEELFLEKLQEVLTLVDDNDNVLPICLSGGCALNVSLNERLRQQLSNPLYVPPNPSDCGLSLGNLLYHLKPEISPMITYSGLPLLDEEQLPTYLEKYSGDVCPADLQNVAELIKEGKIIGICNGGSEVGPRSLGNRSIVCNPGIGDMKGILNAKVKFREWFRPFAPFIRKEDLTTYFQVDDGNTTSDFSYMSFNPLIRDQYREQLKAITHVDGSSRVQTVTRERHPLFYDLLGCCKQLGMLPVLLNTSFNIKGKPILTRIEEALLILETTELDYVYTNGYLFSNQKRQELSGVGQRQESRLNPVYQNFMNNDKNCVNVKQPGLQHFYNIDFYMTKAHEAYAKKLYQEFLDPEQPLYTEDNLALSKQVFNRHKEDLEQLYPNYRICCWPSYPIGCVYCFQRPKKLILVHPAHWDQSIIVYDENGLRGRPIKPDKKLIIIYGDSIIQGLMVKHWLDLANEKLENYQILNAGLSGATMELMLELIYEIKQGNLADKIEAMIIFPGWHNIYQTECFLELLNQCASAAINPILMTIPLCVKQDYQDLDLHQIFQANSSRYIGWWGRNKWTSDSPKYYLNLIQQINGSVTDLARHRDIPYIDLHGQIKCRLTKDNYYQYFFDLGHPDPQKYPEFAEIMLEELGRLGIN